MGITESDVNTSFHYEGFDRTLKKIPLKRNNKTLSFRFFKNGFILNGSGDKVDLVRKRPLKNKKVRNFGIFISVPVNRNLFSFYPVNSV